MRLAVFLPAALVLAAPAFAADPPNADTYKAVIAHGVVLEVPDMPIEVNFTPDGKFAVPGLATGVWKIDGDKLCTTPNETGMTDCAAYPAGKKSGDRFDLETPNGRVTVRIK